MAQELIQETGKDVGNFMKEFTPCYIKALVENKVEQSMDSAVGKLFPDEFADSAKEELGMGGDDEEEKSDEKEEKGDGNLEDKEDAQCVAAGVALISFKLAKGADDLEHRYYDMACWSIKPKDSVITRCVHRHTSLLDFAKALPKKVQGVPKQAFPKKKRFGKKDKEYYKGRYKGMQEYFNVVSKVHAVSSSNHFLKFFNLKYDADRAFLMGIFLEGVRTACESGTKVNFTGALARARKIGIETNQSEILTIVAMKKVGSKAITKLRQLANENAPGFLPGGMKNRFVNKAVDKMRGVIGTGVANGWKVTEEAFNTVAKALSAALDKAKEILEKIFNTALKPIGDLVKKAFDKIKDALKFNDGTGKSLEAARFPPFKKFLAAVGGGGKAVDACKDLLAGVSELKKCNQYAAYLRYNLGNKDVAQFLSFLAKIQDNHFRCICALTDMAYVVARGGVRAFQPLCKVVDNYDEKTFEKDVQDAVREGGRLLAMDYFGLNNALGKTLRKLPKKVANQILRLAEERVCRAADVLGTVASTWKPKGKDDAAKSFAAALAGPLNAFVTTSAQKIVRAVRKGTQALIAHQFMSTIGKTLDDICKTLDDLCSNLPDPLGEHLKPGKIVKYLVVTCVTNAVSFAVGFLASAPEKVLYDPEAKAPEPLDPKAIAGLGRSEPKMRKEGDDGSEMEEEKEEEEDDEKEDGGDDEKEDGGDDEKEDGGDGDEDGGDDNGGDE